MLLCTVAQFKARYGFAGTADDAAIESVIAGASAQIAAECGRAWRDGPCLAEADRTLEFSVPENNAASLWLPAWPISLVESVKEDFNGDWEIATELEEGEDFRIDGRLGRLLSLGGRWMPGEASVQVRWTGGYTLPGDPAMMDYAAWATGAVYAATARVTTGGKYYRCATGHTAAALFATDLAAGKWVEDTLWADWAAAGHYHAGDRRMYLGRYYHCVTAHTGAAAFATDLAAGKWHEDFMLPEDLVEAAIQQAMFVWSRRGQIGMAGGSAGQGGSFSADTKDELLAGVKATCGRYRRL